jgi:hypothetical protein
LNILNIHPSVLKCEIHDHEEGTLDGRSTKAQSESEQNGICLVALPVVVGVKNNRRKQQVTLSTVVTSRLSFSMARGR